MATLTFLGTGPSQGIPVIACGCWVCTSPDSRDKRFRSSVMIEKDSVVAIIDAGPDFRQQMLLAGVKHIDGILITHEHKDHIGGLDEIRSFNYFTGKPVKVYSEERVQRLIKKDFDYAFGEHRYPGAPSFDLITIDEKPFIFPNIYLTNSIDVVPVRGKHDKLPVLGFRIGNIAYITDMKYIEDSEIIKIKGVDTLIINALHKENHISHFSLDEALHISYLVGARQTFLTHISHQMGRFSQIEPELPPGVNLAYDGLKIEVKD